VPSVVQQNVLRLEISIDDIETVQTLEGTEKLGRVESRSVDVKLPFSLEMVEKLPSVDECQDKVELLGRLERELERYDEWIVNLSEDSPLCKGVVHLRA